MTRRIAFTGGGSGGHVFPGIAVWEALRAGGKLEIFWIGSRFGMEKRILAAHGIPYSGIPAGKFRRYLSLKNFLDLFNVPAGLLWSFVILLVKRPLLLFSKGGYVTVPPVIAARILKIPVVTHESDFDPGLATRINARFADRILVSYRETAALFPKPFRDKIVHTGNPVRREFFTGDAAKGRAIAGCPAGMPLLLVLGGSLGATSVNRLIRAVRGDLVKKAFLVHQTGKADRETGGDTPRTFSRPFFADELPHLLAAAALVVSRAGANTLWELAASGRPSILIPLPARQSRGDQIRNAEVFASAGAGVVLSEEEATPQRLLAIVENLLDNSETLARMGEAARRMARQDAADRIAKEIRSLLPRPKRGH